MGTTEPRIAVIGGGITGAFTAFFLTALGARVTLVERDGVGAHASGHNSGGLIPLHGAGIPGPMRSLALESLALHLQHAGEIARLSGTAPGVRRVSRLLVAGDDAELRALAVRRELAQATPGCAARWVTTGELARIEPALGGELAGGLWTDGNARVDPGPYTRAVAAAAVARGAELVTARATGLRSRGARVTAVALDGAELDGAELACDGAVIATGPWCAEPRAWLGTDLPVTPLKGEMLLVDRDWPAPSIEIGRGRVGIYRDADGVWLGGTEEDAGFDAAPTAAGRAEILEGVARLLPDLPAPPVRRHVAALRPLTPDGRPIVGIPDGWENVCVAGGAGRKGMLYGAALGLGAARLVTGAPAGEAIAPCSPDRWSRV